MLALHQPDGVTDDSEGYEVVVSLSLADDRNDRASRLVESFDRGVDPVIVKGLRLARVPSLLAWSISNPKICPPNWVSYDDPGWPDFGIRLSRLCSSRTDREARPDPEDQRDAPLPR